MPLGGGHNAMVAYAILPWTSAMLLGYCFGSLYRKDFNAVRRRKILLYTGLASLAFFILLRSINLYGDPVQWKLQKNFVFNILAFINVNKYPPSLDYLCMTIGTGLIILSFTENVHNKMSRVLSTYGAVPFFYYILHFFIIRLVVLISFYAFGYTAKDVGGTNDFFHFRPTDFGYSLGVVYIMWLAVVASLYYPCKWFKQYKTTHQYWWLSYL